MKVTSGTTEAAIHIESEKITSLIAVLDDLLMNMKIAVDMLESEEVRN
jgi:hypothetical protein